MSSFRIFCQTCCLAREENLVRPCSEKSNSPFLQGGFSNWKKALQRFAEHEKSDLHREASVKLVAKTSSSSIAAQLHSQHKSELRNNRAMFLKVVESVIFLARQGLSLRGHHEDSASMEGNLYQLLLLRANDCPRLKVWLKRRDYVSPETVNEIIAISANTVLRDLLNEIRSAKRFSLIADEATDIAHNEQMCVAVRWVDKDHEIQETPLGLMLLPDTKAHTLFTIVKDTLLRCALALSDCVGQAYDGASNMSGKHNGVQALVKKEAHNCLYVHCFGHSLNLCVQEVSKKCDLIRNTLQFIAELVQLIKFSPKRSSLFNAVRQSISIVDNESPSASPSLRTLCPTRWTVRHSAIDSILKNYTALISTLQVVEEGHDEYAAKGKGLLIRMESFDLFFGLHLSFRVFSAAEQLSVNLQGKDTTVAEGSKGATALQNYYKSLRNEESFDTFFDKILQSSRNITEEPVLPRYRKRPRNVDEGSHPHRFSSPKDLYRQAYYEVLDLAVGELQKRFEQSDLNIVRDIETLLINSANGNGKDAVDIAKETEEYLVAHHVDIARLRVQLPMMPDAIKTIWKGPENVPLKVTSVRTIVDAFNSSDIVKRMLSEVDQALILYLTFPVSSTTAERSFSSLRRIKTFLRSTMTQQRLNNLFILYVHSGRTMELDTVRVAREFVSANSHRLAFFGKY